MSSEGEEPRLEGGQRAHRLPARTDPGLGEHLPDIRLHDARAEEQPHPDLRVRQDPSRARQQSRPSTFAIPLAEIAGGGARVAQRRRTMDFLVEFEVDVPAGTSETEVK